MKASRISGPFSEPPLPNLVCSPLGVCPKKKPDTFRVIHLLSYPEGTSENDGIYDNDSSVEYAKLSDAIRHIKSIVLACYLAKSDIESAFRLLPIHPEDRHLLGISWDNQYYYDQCLPMGCSSSCQLFEKFSTVLEHIVHHCTQGRIVHVLDDFLFIAPFQEECLANLETFISICNELGVSMAAEKRVRLLSCLFLALSVARLPKSKLNKCHDMIVSFLTYSTISHWVAEFCMSVEDLFFDD